MENTVTIELPEFGLLSRNTWSRVITFDDPTAIGSQILRIAVSTVTRPLFYDLFGKGVVAGDRFYLSGVTPVAEADLIGSIATFGPAAGQTQTSVSHTFTFSGVPPHFAHGGANSLSIRNDYNPVEMGTVTLLFTCRVA